MGKSLLRFSVLFLLLTATFWSAQAEQSVYAQVDAIATSETVSINDMASGWDGNYRSGELAFADASFVLGFSSDINTIERSLGTIRLERELRAYYYMSFDKETADFYRALELGNDLTSDKKLDLKVKQFDAVGFSAGYTTPEFLIEDIKFQLGFDLAVYQVNNFQFASVKGIAPNGDPESVSGIVDYRFDEDKLLDANGDPLQNYGSIKAGQGFSFSSYFKMTFEEVDFSLEIKDMFNVFEWDEGLHTTGCVNLSGGTGGACEIECILRPGERCILAAGGDTSLAKITEEIPATFRSKISHDSYDIDIHAMHHDKYYRLGLEKGFQTELGRFGLFLYHPRLVGASWQTDYFNFQFGADTLKLSEARNIQLNMGVNWHW